MWQATRAGAGSLTIPPTDSSKTKTLKTITKIHYATNLVVVSGRLERHGRPIWEGSESGDRTGTNCGQWKRFEKALSKMVATEYGFCQVTSPSRHYIMLFAMP